ncbi:MAG: helix-hairpin-helix domain-containing protein, partial [Longimicrobiales bacterium]
MVDKHAVALVLDEIGTLLDLLGENRFRAGAFHTAARELDRIEGDIETLIRSGELASVRGFGPVTVAVARELVETGDAAFHRDLRERTPSGLVDMLRIPGLGARRIHALHVALGVDTLADLEAAAREGRVAELRGFGEKTQRAILDGLAYVGKTTGRRRQNVAYQVAARLIGTLERVDSVHDVRLAGELRRRLETVDGVDVLAIVDDE